MLCRSVIVVVLATIALAVTSVDACGGPSPCSYLHCTYPTCDDFNDARCIGFSDYCSGWTRICRCEDTSQTCCHDEVCQELDAMENPALLGAESFELTGFPLEAQPAALGSGESGVRLTADGAGNLPGILKINFPRPFLLSSVTLTTSPSPITFFRLSLNARGRPTENHPVEGDSITFSPNKVVDSLTIKNMRVGGINLVISLRLSIMGCLDPACEEADGFCLEQLPKNDGRCALRDGSIGRFYEGPGLSCNGKRDTIKCCRP